MTQRKDIDNVSILSYSKFGPHFESLDLVSRSKFMRVFTGHNKRLRSKEKQTIFQIEVPFCSSSEHKKLFSAIKRYLLLCNKSDQVLKYTHVFVRTSKEQERNAKSFTRKYYLCASLSANASTLGDLKLSPKKIVNLFVESCFCLMIFKEEKFIHNGIVPESFILSKKNKRIKICLTGIGLCLQIKGVVEMVRNGTEKQFISPEKFENGYFTFRGDVFSLGMVFRNLIVYHGEDGTEKVQGKYFSKIPDVIKIILDCASTNPTERPPILEVYNQLKKLYPKKIEKLVERRKEFFGSSLRGSRIGIGKMEFDEKDEGIPDDDRLNESNEYFFSKKGSSKNERKEDDLGEAKFVLLGKASVGKSCILLRYVNREYIEHYSSTIGAAFLTKEVKVQGSSKMLLNVWDTAGQERYDSLTQLYYRDCDAAIIVYDVTEYESFVRAKKWYREMRNQDVDERAVIAFAGNKIDLIEKKSGIVELVDENVVKSWCDDNGVLFFSTSAKCDKGIDEMFSYLANEVSKRKFDAIQSRDISIKPRKVGTNCEDDIGGFRLEPIKINQNNNGNCFSRVFSKSKLRNNVELVQSINFQKEMENITLHTPNISRKKYEIYKCLFVGEQACIFVAKEGPKELVLKRYHPLFIKEFLLEESSLKKLENENVVKYIDSMILKDYFGEKEPVIITEYYKNGDLNNYIKSYEGSISDSVILRMLIDLARGIEYIHSKGYIHNDISSANLFLGNENQIVIGDFGFCVHENAKMKSIPVKDLSLIKNTLIGEIGNFKFKDKKNDILGFGLVALELFTRKIVKVSDLSNKEFSKKINITNQKLKEIIFKCLEKKPKKRPSSKELLELLHNLL